MPADPKRSAYFWEWIWGCCNCAAPAGMTTFIPSCPECQHSRCTYCLLERVRIRSEGGGAGQRRAAYTGNTAQSAQTPSARIEEVTVPSEPFATFTPLSLSPTPDFKSLSASSPSSRHSSLFETPSDSAADLDSPITVSEDSEADGEGVDVVLQMLDIRLASVLSDDLDLAARLIPKIHNRLYSEQNTGSSHVSGHRGGEHFASEGGLASDRNQNTLGGSSFAPNRKEPPSGFSRRKHDRGSDGSNNGGEGNSSNKRSRQDNRDTGDGQNTTGSRGSGRQPNRDTNPDPANEVDGNRNHKTDQPPQNPPDSGPDDPGHDPSGPSTGNQCDDPDYACHFYKRDHIKYGPWNKKYVMCVSSRMTLLRRIKYHFKTVHKSPQCNRCFHLFQNQTELQHHYQEVEGCHKGSPSLKEGIDDRQWEEIEVVLSKKGQKGVDDFSRWYAIWRILFPDVEEPSNPWNAPPSYVASSATNIEDHIAKLKMRINEDVKNGALPADERTHERYIYHIRKLWEEDIAAQGLIQLKSSGKNSEKQIEPPIDNRPTSSNTEHVSTFDQKHSQLPAPTASFLKSIPSQSQPVDDLHVDCQPMTSWHSPRQLEANRSMTVVEPEVALQSPPVPRAAIPSLCWPSDEFDLDFNEDLHNQFYGYDLEGDEMNSFGLSALSVRATNPPSEHFTSDYYMGDDPPDMVSNLLETENNLPEAMATWKDKKTGNKFLRRP